MIIAARWTWDNDIIVLSRNLSFQSNISLTFLTVHFCFWQINYPHNTSVGRWREPVTLPFLKSVQIEQLLVKRQHDELIKKRWRPNIFFGLSTRFCQRCIINMMSVFQILISWLLPWLYEYFNLNMLVFHSLNFTILWHFIHLATHMSCLEHNAVFMSK